MKIILCFISVLLFFMATGYAQESTKASEETEYLDQLNRDLDGTFQVQVVNSRQLPSFPLTELKKIKTSRLMQDTVFYWLNAQTRIMILPETIITGNDYEPLERITYITENN